MAKKIKFPLIMRNGVPVRTMEELQRNFDLKKVLEYYNNGKLMTWLEDRYYTKELKQLSTINEQSNLPEEICNIFLIPYDTQTSVDVEKLQDILKKTEQVKQFTDDVEILDKVDSVAFDQEELTKLIKKGKRKIFLCNTKFYISKQVYEIDFIGLGKPEAIIQDDNYEGLRERKISFKNVVLMDENNIPLVMVTLREAEQLYLSYHIDDAVSFLEQLSEMNNGRAQYILGMIYTDGTGRIQSSQKKAMEYYELGEKNGDILCKFRKALQSAEGIQTIYEYILPMLQKEAEDNDPLALYELGLYYLQSGTNQNYSLLMEYSKRSAELGYWRAWRTCGINYETGRGVDVSNAEAQKCYQRGAEIGDNNCKVRLGELLIYKLNRFDEGVKWLKEVATPNVIKQKVSKLLEEIDSIESKYLSVAPGVNQFKSVLEAGKQFSSVNAAVNYINAQFEFYCQERNKTFMVTNPTYGSLEEYYLNRSKKIIDEANILIHILNEIEKKYSVSEINGVENIISDGLRKLLLQYQKTLASSGFYFDAYSNIYDTTEHNGFFNTTKYWIDTTIESRMKDFIKYDNDRYSKEACDFVKRVLKESLRELKEVY